MLRYLLEISFETIHYKVHLTILHYILYQLYISRFRCYDFSFLFNSFFPSLSKFNLIHIGNRGTITIGRDVIYSSVRFGSARFGSVRLGSAQLGSARSNSVELHLNGPYVIVDGHHLENPRFSDSGSIANRISRAFSLPFSPFSPSFFFFFFSLAHRFLFVPSFHFIEQFSVFISPMTDRPFSLLRNLNIIRCHEFVFVSPLSDSGFTSTLTFSVLERFLILNRRSYQINGCLNQQ